MVSLRGTDDSLLGEGSAFLLRCLPAAAFERREGDADACAALRKIEAGDLAVVFLDDAERGAKAKPCPFAEFLGGVERIEGVLRIGKPRAVVLEFHDDAALLHTRYDADLSTCGGHGVDR